MNDTLVVVTKLSDWPVQVEGVRVVAARDYLTDREFATLRRARVFNLCRHYRYQSLGYYVSLLAEARGHKPVPSVMTMQDLRTPVLARMASEELDRVIQRSLAPISSDRFVLSIYFGHNVARRHQRLATALFKLFPAPFLRATFVRDKRWELTSVSPFPLSAIPEDHRDFALDRAGEFFTGEVPRRRRRKPARYDMAILVDPEDATRPSDDKAIARFIRAAEELGIAAETISRDEAGLLAQYDALFIRATTAVNHYTYRFSRRAAEEGLVVIDDPQSILRCTNKVYLAELLERAGVPTPRTRILHRDNISDVERELGYPVIVKRPDSSTSLGVHKADSADELRQRVGTMLEGSELLIAQEFLPTEFDWRIGVLDRKPLYAARYYMAQEHWQIVHYGEGEGRTEYGDANAIPVQDVPKEGLALALKAANLIGDGFYGVDLKQMGDRWVVIEVNDNPSVDHEIEDAFLGDALYRKVMDVFLSRLEARGARKQVQ